MAWRVERRYRSGVDREAWRQPLGDGAGTRFPFGASLGRRGPNMRDYLLLLFFLLFFLVFFLLLFLGVLNQCRAWALCDRSRQFLLPSFSPSSPYRSRPLPQQQVQGSPQQEQGSPPQSDDGVGVWRLGIARSEWGKLGR